MAIWKVLYFIRPGGKCPARDFLASTQVSPQDRRKVETRVRMLSNVEQIPHDWVVDYKSTNLQRLKPNCQLRFLCCRENSTKSIVLFNGMLKKGKHLPPDKIIEAETMLAEFRLGLGNVEDYQFD